MRFPQYEVCCAMPLASGSYLHHKDMEPSVNSHPRFQLIRDRWGPLQVLVLADTQPAAVLGTASLPAERFDLAGCTSIELPVYGAAEQVAGAGGKREQIASVALSLQVSSVAGGVLQGPFSAIQRFLSAVHTSASCCRVPQVTDRPASAVSPAVGAPCCARRHCPTPEKAAGVNT